jgi:hypothetical protein
MRSISCPFCGVRSNLALDVQETGPRTWTQDCPVCGRPWKMMIWSRRGLPELVVEPGVRADAPAKEPAKAPPARRKKRPARKTAKTKARARPAPARKARKARNARPAKKTRKR